ncbi:MAG: hypothetical protein NWS85_01765, partial [Hydrogenophaga sp.]|nr:hypothetical protein [Hydrogenophaga sp.]
PQLRPQEAVVHPDQGFGTRPCDVFSPRAGGLELMFKGGCLKVQFERMEQATTLMQDRAAKAATALVDLTYCSQSKRISVQERKLLKRLQTIESIIGRL